MFDVERKLNKAPKPVGMTDGHGGEEYVRKDAPLIRFRGALDHAMAEVIITQTLLQQDKTPQNEELTAHLQELLCTLRQIMSAEYSGEEVKVERLFGYPLDELQKRSHNAKEYYGIATMTRPDFSYGPVYARLNLLRTELRLVESAAVELFLGDADTEPARPDILHLLNRMSSGLHVLMCKWLSDQYKSI